MRVVTVTVEVVEELIEEVEAALAFVELRAARLKLLGIITSLKSLRDEAK